MFRVTAEIQLLLNRASATNILVYEKARSVSRALRPRHKKRMCSNRVIVRPALIGEGGYQRSELATLGLRSGEQTNKSVIFRHSDRVRR